MPFKSKAQMKKWGELVRLGKISQATYDEALAATKQISKLPNRVPKKGSNKVRRVKII